MKRFIGLSAPSMAVAVLLAPLLGCKSDLSQQLLERELRMQEDQIYQLQDELQNASHQIDRVARENTSLKRQLGFADGDAATGGRRGPAVGGPAPRTAAPTSVADPAATPQALLAPPAIEVPGVGSPAGNAAPAPAPLPPPEIVAPPRLDGVPPLPSGPRFPGAAAPAAASVVPASATEPVAGEPHAGAGRDRPLSREESLADAGRIAHIVINPARTECFDGNGDGLSDGLAVVIEPRDGDERLVTAAGDLVLSVFEASDPPGTAPVARWEIPAQETLAHFRRTSRNRGLHFVLRWPGAPPRGDHVRVQAVLTTFEAAAFETDCTVAVRP